MRILPRTLFARTAVLIAVLILVSQIGWLVITRTLVDLYSHGAHQHPVADMAVVVDRELIRLPPASRRSRARALVAGTGARVAWIPPQGPLRTFARSDPFVRILVRHLGPKTGLVEEKHTHELWIRLPVPHARRNYWLVVPESPFWRALPYTTLLGLVFGLLVAALGAVLVSNRLSRQLHRVTEAAEAIGRGAPPPPLREQGARELRRLSAGINRMVEDLHTRAEDHREILAGISHDLRTPLTRMRLALELSSDQLEPELAQGMGQDLDDMDRIIGRFLDYARHGSEESPAAIDFVPLVREVVDRYRRGETAIVLETPASCPLHGRPLALVRLVTNLVDNAVRHAHTAIHVRLETTPTGCVLTVEDRGPGLDPAKAQALFAPLRPRPGATAGLGLRTVGRIARLHNAEVKVTARPGGGTRVAVTFPGAPTADASAEAAEHPNP